MFLKSSMRLALTWKNAKGTASQTSDEDKHHRVAHNVDLKLFSEWCNQTMYSKVK